MLDDSNHMLWINIYCKNFWNEEKDSTADLTNQNKEYLKTEIPLNFEKKK